MMTIEIIRDPRHPTTHSVAKVIVRGRVYAVTWLILLAHEEHVASNGQRFGWLFEKCDPPCRRHAKPEAEKHE